ncbi:UNVERIFIED_CONTAM: hypothetical protein Scaly_1205600 [Sesamum calycinum]|uniref:Uncharacterized protein n=1 Tax=Sesamum calycinum TaxID=2727403 RepID=A0AAW2Q411_9LAMI
MLGGRSRLLKQSRNTRNVQFPVLFMFLILVLVALLLILGKNGHKSSLMSDLVDEKWNGFDSLVGLDPTVEFRNGTDLIWQIPDSPKAVLFLAHGCNGRAVNFWDKSPNCPNCVGLPEERLIVLHALARKFAVLAVSSKGICWSLGEERWIVKDIIQWWITKQKVDKLPIFALVPHPVDTLSLSLRQSCHSEEKGFIDKNGYMRDDGRAIPWKTALEERNILLPEKSLINHIQEEMNLAFAYHEMTSLQSEQILDWVNDRYLSPELDTDSGLRFYN